MANPKNIQALLDEVNAAGSALLELTAGAAGTGLITEGPASRTLITAAQNLIVGLQDPGTYMEEIQWQVRQRSFPRGLTSETP
jgi:hypothetical protein